MEASRTPSVRSYDKSVDTVINGIRRLVRAIRVFSREIEKDFGITGAQLFVLQSLGQSPGQSLGQETKDPLLSINELAERSFTHQSTVSEVVARLKKKKLVVQRKSEEDLRKTFLSLSPTGKTLLKRAPETPQVRLVRGLMQLSAKERTQLADLLDRVLSTSGFGDELAAMFFEEK
jgi:MarR family transcriptional regulator, lower aerobic nicotinate degradation pathway regulator